MLFPSRVAGRLEASWRSFELEVFFFSGTPYRREVFTFYSLFSLFASAEGFTHHGE